MTKVDAAPNGDRSSQTLIIGERKGGFQSMLQNRTINVVFVDTSHGIDGEVRKKLIR